MGIINVHINQLDQQVKNQPDIICKIKARDLELSSINQHLNAFLDDGALFYRFLSNTYPNDSDLTMRITAQNLKQLIFRFDPNPKPS